jgi:pimeloyl-ACP methyl ester carboxylesterase
MAEDVSVRDKQVAAPRRQAGVRWLKRGALLLGLLVLCGGGLLLLPRPLPDAVTAHAQPPLEPFSLYVARRNAQARQEGVRPGNEERVAWWNPLAPDTRAPVVLLYVHGFGASRAEGEATVEPIAQALHATTYYTRLPGHGGDLERHAAARPEQYFALLEEDFHRLRPLGDKFVVIGSSTGGLLAAWLAARHPTQVDAVVLGSPLVEMAAPGAFLLSRRWGLGLVQAMLGEYRDAGWRVDPEKRKQLGYEDFWITRQRMSAIGIVEDVRRQALREAPAADITAPILLFYYYADKEHQDDVCRVSAMRAYVAGANHGSPHPQTRSVAIADGNHILFSRYVRTDKDTIGRELLSFLHAVLQNGNHAGP